MNDRAFRVFGVLVILALLIVLTIHQRSGVAQARGDSGIAGQTEGLAVDSIFGRGSSLAIDDKGYPHVSYFESGTSIAAGRRLRYAAEIAPGIWQFEVLTNWGDSIGNISSLALDAEGNPHIAFTHNSKLRYARKVSSFWEIETVDGVNWVSSPIDLRLDRHDDLHIAYTSDSNVMYASLDAQGWHTTEVYILDAVIIRYVTLALDKDDRPHLGFSHAAVMAPENDCARLYYAYQHGEGWHTEIADYFGGGWYPALALDSMNHAHFSYQGGCSNEFGQYYKLKYAHRSVAAPTLGEWQTEEVDEDGERESRLLLDTDDRPHISYSATDRMYATKGETDWQKMEVDYRFGPCISDEVWSLDNIGRPLLTCVSEGMELITWSPWPTHHQWLPLVLRQ